MPRNLYRRVEVAFPIEDPKLAREIVEEMLPAFLKDRVKARELQADGRYLRLKPKPGAKLSQAQLYFRERARKRVNSLGEETAKAKANPKLIPITKVK